MNKEELVPQKQLVFLASTPFEIFAAEGKLKEYGKPENCIELSSYPLTGNDDYEFVFNKVTGRVEPSPITEKVEEYERIVLPRIGTLEDNELGDWQRERLNKLSRDYQWGVFFADSYMRQPLNGGPTEYNFGGTNFTLDVKRYLLFESANPENQIKLNKVPSSPHGYEIYYDPKAKNLYPEDDWEGHMPFFLDQLVNCDPLAMAKHFGISPGRLPELDMYLENP